MTDNLARATARGGAWCGSCQRPTDNYRLVLTSASALALGAGVGDVLCEDCYRERLRLRLSPD